MKKSEFLRMLNDDAGKDWPSQSRWWDQVAALAERAGARWDPEEPTLPGGAWRTNRHPQGGDGGMVVDDDGEALVFGDRARSESELARQRAVLARLVAIREAARALRTPIMVLPEASPCCINMANLHALFSLLGEP